jgi:hypothetical protein
MDGIEPVEIRAHFDQSKQAGRHHNENNNNVQWQQWLGLTGPIAKLSTKRTPCTTTPTLTFQPAEA